MYHVAIIANIFECQLISGNGVKYTVGCTESSGDDPHKSPTL